MNEIDNSDKELRYYYDYKNKYGPNHYMQSNYTKANLYDIRDDEDEVDDTLMPKNHLDIVIDAE